MKDFCKWLGVSDKVAKLVVWLFIGMGMLIVFNTALESFGLPYYKLTVDNLSKLDTNIIFDYLLNWMLIILNFYTAVLLVFRVEKAKKIFPYAIMYLILNILIKNLFGSFGVQTFIFSFIIIFCYVYSGKKWKYLIYGLASMAINTFIQYLTYLYKIRFIDYPEVGSLNRFLISIDFFIIMFIIIFIKELILRKKKGE